MSNVIDLPLTVKTRTGVYTDKNILHTLIPKFQDWGVSLVTVSFSQLCIQARGSSVVNFRTCIHISVIYLQYYVFLLLSSFLTSITPIENPLGSVTVVS